MSFWLAGGLCVAALLLAFPAEPQTSEFYGKPVADIQFPNGQPLDPADLARVLPFKKGQPLRAADVAHAIDELFATGRFEDIVVEAGPFDRGASFAS